MPFPLAIVRPIAAVCGDSLICTRKRVLRQAPKRNLAHPSLPSGTSSNQDSLRNLAAGTMILAYRPYGVDDRVKVAGAEGIVKRMNLLATTVATIDNQMLVVPDGRIWGDTIVNFTANRVRRADVKVNVS